ncbi:MAG: metallophosphoesterase family protein [Pseudomonadota bacterium]|nr:metallophosphoesterase family protein [Pseudomonadota bacterium]
MLEKLFGAKRGADDRLAAAPAGLRLYAVGDIHGCAGQLDALLKLIEEEPAAAVEKRLIFLGDYVDRGPDSRSVIDRLVALAETQPQTVFLKGNHEAAMLDFLDAPDAEAAWLGWGGAETLQSYGVSQIFSREPHLVAEEFADRLPAPHRRFLDGLDLYRTFGDYVFVHAGLRPGVALEAQEERDLLWIRGEFHNAPPEARPDKFVVHGHHPVRRPLDAGWRIDADTGACYGGKLTAAVLEGTERRFLSA